MVLVLRLDQGSLLVWRLWNPFLNVIDILEDVINLLLIGGLRWIIPWILLMIDIRDLIKYLRTKILITHLIGPFISDWCTIFGLFIFLLIQICRVTLFPLQRFIFIIVIIILDRVVGQLLLVVYWCYVKLIFPWVGMII